MVQFAMFTLFIDQTKLDLVWVFKNPNFYIRIICIFVSFFSSKILAAVLDSFSRIYFSENLSFDIPTP